MGKDPAVLFYTADFLIGVQSLTMEERGQYITLLCVQHQQGHLTEKIIRLSVGTLSPDVKAKFSVDENGLLYHPRMEEETNKRRAYSESRHANGSKGGRPSLKKHMDNHMDKHMDKHMGNENENIDVITNVSNSSNSNKDNTKVIDNVLLERFDRFWAVYPRKVGKGDAKKAFLKLKPSDMLTDKMIEAVKVQARSEQWTRDKGQYIPHPATWINQERWEDSPEIEYPEVEVKEVILF